MNFGGDVFEEVLGEGEGEEVGERFEELDWGR